MKRNASLNGRGNRLQPRPRKHSLTFSPTAWAKLLFLRDLEHAEVGGFGITQSDDLLHVTDLRLVTQTCSLVSVAFNDTAVADYFDEQVDRGLEPEQFSRIWIHTHPGHCPLPSMTDDSTFTRVFGTTEWSVMFILAAMGNSYARLRFNCGPGGDLELAAKVDFSRPFAAADTDQWRAEHAACVTLEESIEHRFQEPLFANDITSLKEIERGWDDRDYPSF